MVYADKTVYAAEVIAKLMNGIVPARTRVRSLHEARIQALAGMLVNDFCDPLYNLIHFKEFL